MVLGQTATLDVMRACVVAIGASAMRTLAHHFFPAVKGGVVRSKVTENHFSMKPRRVTCSLVVTWIGPNSDSQAGLGPPGRDIAV